ncbi:MAG: preprotein translocase subunit SecG [Rhodothermales bacterium]
MFTFVIVLISIIAILISLVVLVQSGKGGGLAGIAAGGATQQVLGARQAPDVLEKATWILATAFISLCILSNFIIDRSGTGTQDSVIQQSVQGDQVLPPAEIPALPPATVPTETPSTTDAPASSGGEENEDG